MCFVDWLFGIGDWGLGIGPNPKSPIPNPQSPIPIITSEMNFILLINNKNIPNNIFRNNKNCILKIKKLIKV